MQSNNPYALSIKKGAGLVDYREDSLARDASLVVAYPYPPGDHFFYVDDTLQIRAGDKILFSTAAENSPDYFRAAAAHLYRLRVEQARLLPIVPAYAQMQADIDILSAQLVDYYQGQKRVKSERVVAYVDPARKLITVTEAFDIGFKPRVMGAVTRILGFVEDTVDEPTTEKLHTEAGKLYGGYDWEAEWRETGKFPIVKR